MIIAQTQKGEHERANKHGMHEGYTHRQQLKFEILKFLIISYLRKVGMLSNTAKEKFLW